MKESCTFVPCIESPDETHDDWVVCNYLDADDIRYRGTYAECESFLQPQPSQPA